MIKNKIESKFEKRQWILGWLDRHFHADATNGDFHDEYFEKFGGRRKETDWGTQPVYEAQRLLKELFDEGLLERDRVNLSSYKHPVYPRWVWVYSKHKISNDN